MMKKCSWIVLGRRGDIPLVTCLAVSSRSQSESDLNGDSLSLGLPILACSAIGMVNEFDLLKLPVRLRQAEGAGITSGILTGNENSK